jgi:hypothetical protein
MGNKRGQPVGTQRGNRQRFPYEPRVIGGKLMMPADLQAIHRYVVETPVLENVTEEIRAVIEAVFLNCCPSYRRGCETGRRLINGHPHPRIKDHFVITGPD